jgi:hypothetical protein
MPDSEHCPCVEFTLYPLLLGTTILVVINVSMVQKSPTFAFFTFTSSLCSAIHTRTDFTATYPIEELLVQRTEATFRTNTDRFLIHMIDALPYVPKSATNNREISILDDESCEVLEWQLREASQVEAVSEGRVGCIRGVTRKCEY